MRIQDLTPRQHRVACMIAEGLTDRQMAAQLGISEDGVADFVRKIATTWNIDRSRNIRVQIAVRVMRAA